MIGIDARSVQLDGLTLKVAYDDVDPGNEKDLRLSGVLATLETRRIRNRRSE